MIKLTEEDRNIIDHLGFPKIVELSQGKFLVKAVTSAEVANELIGKKLADVFKVKCPNYHLVNVNGQYYYLSEDLNQLGEFVSAGDIVQINSKYSYMSTYVNHMDLDFKIEPGLYGNNIYDIWAYFDSLYDKKTVMRLMYDIMKIYIFDLLFVNFDRRPDNWGILTSGQNQVDVVMLDNEFSFDPSTYVSMFAYAKGWSNVQVDVEFSTFLKEASREYIDLFKYYYDLITPEFLEKIVDEVGLENGLVWWSNNLTEEENLEKGAIRESKEDILERFTKRREELFKMYSEYVEAHYGR